MRKPLQRPHGKKGFLLLLLVVLLQTAPGCWRGRELDARAFVTAVAFDLTTEEGADPDEFLLSIQVPIPAKMAGEGGDQGGDGKAFVVYGTTTKMVTTGIRQLQRQLDRELFFGHTHLIIFNVEVAKAIGVDRLLDYFKRDFRVQRRARIAVIDGEARDILAIEPPISQTPAAYIENLLSGQSASGINYISDFGRFLVEQGDVGVDPVLPRVTKGKETVLTGGGAVIKNGKFVGWLENTETRALNILLNRNIISVYEVKCPLHPHEDIVVRTTGFGSRYRLDNQKGRTVMRIRVVGQFETVEFTGKHGPLAGIQDDLEKAVSAKVRAEVEQVIQKAQELGADIIGVGRYLHAYEPGLWRTMDWEREFPAFPIEVEVDMRWTMTVRRFGG